MSDELKQVIDMMNSLFSTLNEKIDSSNSALNLSNQKMMNEIKDIKKRVVNIETTLENETNKNIQLLAEGYKPLTDSVNQIKEDVDIVKFDVDIVKKVVTTHSTELNQLKKAR